MPAQFTAWWIARLTTVRHAEYRKAQLRLPSLPAEACQGTSCMRRSPGGVDCVCIIGYGAESKIWQHLFADWVSKCDLARPACQRCTKYGAVCPGYRDQQELVFRHANPSTVKQRRKRKDATAAAGDKDGGTEGDDSKAIVTCPGFVESRGEPAANTVGSMILHGQVTEHWTAQSVPLLLDVYSAMSFLRNVYATDCSNGPLLWSAHIFTRTYIMNVRYPTQIENAVRVQTQRELGMYMGKTLRAVNRALSTPDGAQRDDILATVWILANHEVLAGTLGRHQPVNTWQLHAHGIYSLLKARGSDRLYTSAGRTAFWPSFNIVQLQALIINIPCPVETDEWLDICGKNPFEGEELTLRIAEYIARICTAQARMMPHIRVCDFRGASADYRALRQMLLDADEAFDVYLSTRSPLGTSHVQQMTMDVYMHNMQCAAVIKSNHVMQMLCNLLTHYATCPVPLAELLAHRRHALQRIRTSAQAIINNLPVAMEPLSRTTVFQSPQVLFDAMKLVFPLFLVAHIPDTMPDQKAVAMQALRFIGKEVGIRQALAADNGSSTLPEESRAPLVTDMLAEPPWVAAPPRDYTLLGF